MTAVEVVEGQTIADGVAAALRAMIGTGELIPGEPIVIESTAQRLGVSAQPVREALKTLESEGRVEHVAHRGARVVALSEVDLVELDTLRALLEEAELRASIPELDEAALDRLRAIGDALAEAERVDSATDIVRLHGEFIEILRSASRNRRLAASVSALRAATEPYRHRYFALRSERGAHISLHPQIVEAAQARDTTTVVELVARQRQLAFDALRRSGALVADSTR